METKLSVLTAAWARGDYRAVLRIAVKFPRLGSPADKAAVERAWQALQRPGFVREVARDPDADLAAGLDAIRARYNLPPLGVEPDRL